MVFLARTGCPNPGMSADVVRTFESSRMKGWMRWTCTNKNKKLLKTRNKRKNKYKNYRPNGLGWVLRQESLPLGVNLLEVLDLPPGDHKPETDSIAHLSLIGAIWGKRRDVSFLDEARRD